ncbi:hypothetical protein XI09_30690 [Bradyrhizobium sp. CCBAU 11386]|uniref:hypothetical protein n=1 Tax=Bradyrhizobium sp. CCBAU 11386 TaxID=1630837 RepID=UPI00230251AE|nr:hypothetical protein [Bradyrhizobium sp. CCBAU 11386]MDA9508926.1 hypothetical protein [Bradyrhizobium sp. CCBAU 11386]
MSWPHRDLLWSKTLIRAGADLGVSEYALRQLCKRLLIPLPTRGHFNHKESEEAAAKAAIGPETRLKGSTRRMAGEYDVIGSPAWFAPRRYKNPSARTLGCFRNKYLV